MADRAASGPAEAQFYLLGTYVKAVLNPPSVRDVRVAEAKDMVLGLMVGDSATVGMPVPIDPRSPDVRDPGKFLLNNRVARAIHHFDGWYVPINLDWFAGSYDEPVIQRTPFYWYAFAIPRRNRYLRDHYMICDYLQMREWVLDFAAPLDRDHRDHS